MLLFADQCAMLFLDPQEPNLAQLLALTREYVIISTAFFFPLSLVNIVRFSIQGMGYSTFAILAGVLEMIARTVMGQFFVPVFGYVAACFASPMAWICADLFLVPASMWCISRLRRLYPSQPEKDAQKNITPVPVGIGH
jgi:Na+-driven multidrug efflux pump